MRVDAASEESPIYFMTEDDVTRGVTQVNILNGTPFEPVSPPINIESVIATLPTGEGGCQRAVEVEPLLRATRRLVPSAGRCAQSILPAAAEPQWELHNLTGTPRSDITRLMTMLRRSRP